LTNEPVDFGFMIEIDFQIFMFMVWTLIQYHSSILDFIFSLLRYVYIYIYIFLIRNTGI